MSISEEIIGDIVIETINSNRATLIESENLKKLIYDKVEKGYKKIIIDLSNAEFIDSTFLGVIVNGLKKVVSLGGDLKLVGFKPAVRSMFELTRLFRVFESYPELQSALKSFQK
ncbi:STAS domain-containing protein [Rosettibacter firmus]|uniref:STAS domain-containing protein n=1 Tax=Rosettibacter firmus TaxID=3111522 RepID=UPI00336BE22A